MIAYISGVVAEREPGILVIDIQGLGYRVFVSMYTYERVQGQNKVKLYTYHHIREDDQLLYGFAEQAELQAFEWLISVNGVGTNTARLILSSLSASELKQAVVGEQEHVFKKIKGVGPKTAKRIIIDLKDKVIKEGVELESNVKAHNTGTDEALSALVALGIPRPKAKKAVNLAIEDNPEIKSVEELVKQALKMIS